MDIRYAAAYGGLAGLLIGVVASVLNDLGLMDTLYRLLILSVGGAWIGGMLAGISDFLSPDKTDVEEQGKRS